MAKEYVNITRFELTQKGRDAIHLLTVALAAEALLFFSLHFHEAVQMVGGVVDFVSGPLTGSLDLLDQLRSMHIPSIDLSNPADTEGLREKTIPTITRDPNGVMRAVQDFFNFSGMFNDIAQQGK